MLVPAWAALNSTGAPTACLLYGLHRMKHQVREAFDQHLRAARDSEARSEIHNSWHHLELAHILSQAYAGAHLRVHWLMFCFALRQRNVPELLGQIPRLLLAAPGSWTGRAPRGNTGGANVGISTPMPIPAELVALLEE